MTRAWSSWMSFVGATLLALVLVLALELSRDSDQQAPATTSIHFKLAAGAPELEVEAFDGRVASILPLFDRAPSELAADRAFASARSGEPAPDLERWRRMVISPFEADSLLEELQRDPRVVSAFAEPAFELPSFRLVSLDTACPVKTPIYQPHQGYLSAAPRGINAPVAWARPGGRGEKITFADIEGAWNFAHEDIPGERMTLAAGSQIQNRSWEAHGTAVIGVIAARDNGLGMLGIAPEVEKILVGSIGRTTVANAIDRVQAQLEPGSVLLIELQTGGPRGRWVPVEFWDDIFEVIKTATGRGVIVVEAAGNGAEDLDRSNYLKKFDRNYRDSGAILVGAGAPAIEGFVDRARLDFSNYGSRVDVQGWGRMVATLDYGDLQNCDATRRKYTRTFSGTSSASPVVAGAAVLVQGISKAKNGRLLDSKEMRELLASTGSPQTYRDRWRPKENIGPRPDLARALDKLDEKY